MPDDLDDFAPIPMASHFRTAVQAFRDRGVVGRDAEVAKLAMAAARFHATGHRAKLLILGGPAAGKTALAYGAAAALRLPINSHHASTLSGTGWHGKTIPDIMENRSGMRTDTTLLLDGLEAVAMTRGAHGNAVDRVTQIQGDIASVATGNGPATALICTANLPRLRVPRFGIIGAEALMEAGLAGLAHVFNLVVHLPPLTDHDACELVTTRALLAASSITASTGYRVIWSGAALAALRQLTMDAGALGVAAGIRAVHSALDAALLNAVAMDIAEGGRVGISPEHVIAEGDPPALPWGEAENERYGGM